MEKRFVYADNAATTPMSETAFNAMKPWLTENYGNPSSLYRIGRAAKDALNDARTVVGKCLKFLICTVLFLIIHCDFQCVVQIIGIHFFQH